MCAQIYVNRTISVLNVIQGYSKRELQCGPSIEANVQAQNKTCCAFFQAKVYYFCTLDIPNIYEGL